MNKVFHRTLVACWFLFVCLVLAGCASTRKIDWNSRLGTYNYDQAVTELGPPDKSAVLSDNSRVAEWLIYRGGSYGTVYTYQGAWVHSFQESSAPDSFLRLTFDSQGILRSWNKLLK
jgi:hypothetical protein